MDVHILINMIEMVYPDIKIEPDQDHDEGDCTIYHPHLTKIDYDLKCDIIAGYDAICIAFDFRDFGDYYTDYIAEVLLLDFQAKVEELFKLVPFHDNGDSTIDYKKYAVVDINPDYKEISHGDRGSEECAQISMS